jgi:uncharacterized protein (TIGR02246 family)
VSLEITPADYAAIQQLYARQSHAVDAGDGPAWAESFAVDGVLRSPTYDGAVSGSDQLSMFAESFHAAMVREGVTRRHWITALALDPADDVVAARCYAMVIATRQGAAPQIERSVVFRDTLAQRDGHWVITRRDVEVDGVG